MPRYYFALIYHDNIIQLWHCMEAKIIYLIYDGCFARTIISNISHHTNMCPEICPKSLFVRQSSWPKALTCLDLPWLDPTHSSHAYCWNSSPMKLLRGSFTLLGRWLRVAYKQLCHMIHTYILFNWDIKWTMNKYPLVGY
mgnify:CR=1 FL=1